METTVVRILNLMWVVVNNFLTLTGDDMLIAYTLSDGTYLIFGGDLCVMLLMTLEELQ